MPIDREIRKLYNVNMAVDNPIQPLEAEFERLESRIDELIRTCEGLAKENMLLRARQEALVGERAQLVEKTDLARTRIEAMITRLKSLEQEA
jgi:TIGR02449 family protein